MASMPSLTPDRITKLAFGFMPARVVLSAIDLELFTTLDAAGPLTADELRARLGLHQRSAVDFFDALVAMELLEREGGRYRNGPEASEYLVRDKDGYIGWNLAMASTRLYPHWGKLTESLRTGQPQGEAAESDDFFSALYADPVRLKEFLAAMSTFTDRTGGAIAQTFPWSQVKTFVDVGTAEGALPIILCTRHPHLSGLGFDLPAVRPFFDAAVATANLSSRLRFIEGSFFTDELPHADVVIMGHVLHDWNLDQKKLLIAKAYRALPANGVFIAYESIIDDERKANISGLLGSLNMLIETPGGFDYAFAEARSWLLDAGFKSAELVPLVGPKSMIVARKHIGL